MACLDWIDFATADGLQHPGTNSSTASTSQIAVPTNSILCYTIMAPKYFTYLLPYLVTYLFTYLIYVRKHLSINSADRKWMTPVDRKKFRFFYSDTYRDTSNARARFTISDIHAGLTQRHNSCTSSDLWRVCYITKFAFSCIRFVVHPIASILQPYEGLNPPSRSRCQFIEHRRMKGSVGLISRLCEADTIDFNRFSPRGGNRQEVTFWSGSRFGRCVFSMDCECPILAQLGTVCF